MTTEQRRNTRQQLLAEIKALRDRASRLDRVVDEAREYAVGHHQGCGHHEFTRCTCSLDNLNEAFQALDSHEVEQR